ncbi:TRAP transporter small permease [Thioalkalivibrio thiocyanodenitrificans]|uniref:TRAP transporter small permease n=1 Tax=Thioalkalivibrio thiocyanodenitrificans TaxID=243063 RepID=UPI0003A3F369|nr:TRAP transporter small permease [Thioalkalivibrio thiocyanodenitrificans]
MRTLYWLDRNIEKIIILIAYSFMAGIICVEVVRRFLFNVQAPWSTSIPILLFLWLAWFGASYNVRRRTHLSLDEIRIRLPYSLQFGCHVLDAMLWIGFAIIVIYFASQQVVLAHQNFAIVPGTDNMMQWWFYLATPLAWSLIIVRALQNLYEDWRTFRTGRPFDQPTLLD